MKVAILAGGLGSRLAADGRPKPLVEIGGRPILWHVLRHFADFGHDEFVVAVGRDGDVVERGLHAGLDGDRSWDVRCVRTGAHTGSAGRLARLAPWLGGAPFLLAWCDGLTDLDLDALLAFHRAHGRPCTAAAVRPIPRFGHLELDGDRVAEFAEKARPREGWISGGLFVCEPRVLDRLGDDASMLEDGLLPSLARDGELMAFRHDGFWHCMDTPQDRDHLRELWAAGRAPWRRRRARPDRSAAS